MRRLYFISHFQRPVHNHCVPLGSAESVQYIAAEMNSEGYFPLLRRSTSQYTVGVALEYGKAYSWRNLPLCQLICFFCLLRYWAI